MVNKWQMAYQRSMKMTVNVNTDTATDTACNIENDRWRTNAL